MTNPVTITPRFRRSIRIDKDHITYAALEGFICPASFQVAVKFMADHIATTEQGAFTWTGPYGGGKSSLALALTFLFDASKADHEKAAAIFGDSVMSALKTALPDFPTRWDVLPLVTERRSIATQLADILKLRANSTTSEILGELELRTKNRGLLLIMDELGRGLEAAADGDGDLHLLQDVAEFAARSKGRLVFLGILHQTFEEYALRLGRKSRESWSKVQGRFIDISISISLEETVEMIGKALGQQRAKSSAIPLAKKCVEQLRPRRKKTEAKQMVRRLARTAPLHPLTACLIGPVSRRRFSQNQRSVFSFLNSVEPYGLQDARIRKAFDEYYPPHLLWNYLKANLEAAILSSPDGRRWALALDVLERCTARGASEIERRILKTIAIFDMFKERSSISANLETIALALHGVRFSEVKTALCRLERQSEIVFRKHSGTYLLFAGSDFDVDARLTDVLAEREVIDLGLVRTLADLQPMLAKRHFEETGAMRWFEMSIEPVSALKSLAPPNNAQEIIGRIVFTLPMEGEGQKEVKCVCDTAVNSDTTFPLIIGQHADANRLLELVRELEGLNNLDSRFEDLRGDPIAKREIDARSTEVCQKLESRLQSLINECFWHEMGQIPRKLTKRQLNERLSAFADTLYCDSPHIRNELLNCSIPSPSAVSARTKLMKRMVKFADVPDLGFDGNSYPAERGLYISLLRQTSIYVDGIYHAPVNGDKLFPLWREADKLLEASDSGVVTAAELIQTWSMSPIGLKTGLGPIYVIAYVFTRCDRLAVYGEGVFQSNFNELCVEFLARDPKDIGLRCVELNGFIGDTLEALGSLLKLEGKIEPLVVARTIIGEFDKLTPWTLITQSLSWQTLQVREILKRASDPNKMLFSDLPSLTEPLPNGNLDANATAFLLRNSLAELRSAYPKVLDELKLLMLEELDVRSQSDMALRNLRDRADNIRQIGGDLRLDAFVGRIAQFHGTREDMEGIAGVTINKLPRRWNDSDWERAEVELVRLATSFLKMETIARVKGRKERRHAFAVVIGKEKMPHSLFLEFEVSDVDRHEVEHVVENLDHVLSEADRQNREIILAALIEVTTKYINGSGVKRMEEQT